MIDFEAARQDMVEMQLVPRGIVNKRVLEAIRKVPRHRFVSDRLKDSAYLDHPLPIGCGQTISQPYMVAFMTEALELSGEEKVLEVGTGSGYQAAILAELAGEVRTIERINELADEARELLASLGYTNISIGTGDGSEGWKEFASYEAIIVTAASPDIPDALLEQLADGGRLAIPVGSRYSQELIVVSKSGGQVHRKNLGGCVFVPLIGKFGWKE